jgi:hypothetical protein
MVMLVLYTEAQLHRAYKIYIRDFCTSDNMIPSIELFREMFEEDENIQELAEGELHEH